MATTGSEQVSEYDKVLDSLEMNLHDLEGAIGRGEGFAAVYFAENIAKLASDLALDIKFTSREASNGK